MLNISLWIAFIFCAFAAMLLVVRLLSSKTSTMDKLLALDTLYLIAVIWIILAGAYWQHTYYWAIALVVALANNSALYKVFSAL